MCVISIFQKIFKVYLFKKIFLVFIFETERERQSASRGGAEREGDPESEAGSKLLTVGTEPDAGLDLTDREVMTWAKVDT